MRELIRMARPSCLDIIHQLQIQAREPRTRQSTVLQAASVVKIRHKLLQTAMRPSSATKLERAIPQTQTLRSSLMSLLRRNSRVDLKMPLIIT